MSPSSERLRMLGVAAVVALLLLVVAATAVEVPGAAPSGRFFSWRSESVADWVVPIIRLAYLMVLFLALYSWLAERQPGTARRRGGKRVSPLATFVALVFVAVFVILVLPNLRSQNEAVTTTSLTPVAGQGEAPAPEDDVAVPLGEPGRAWWIMLVAGGGALVYLVVSRRRVTDVPHPVLDAGPGGSSSAETRQPPSGAAERVLAAYRGVEVAAAERGLRRAPAETAARHLGRVGAVADAASATELTVLFHTARYSGHTVSDEAATTAEEDGRRLVEGLDE